MYYLTTIKKIKFNWMPTEPNFTDEIFFHKEKEELILKPFCRVLPILKSDNLKRENSIKKCFRGVH